VQQDAGDREGWWRRAVKGLANPHLAWKIRQDNKLMLMIPHSTAKRTVPGMKVLSKAIPEIHKSTHQNG